jgi:hypothetical protein
MFISFCAPQLKTSEQATTTSAIILTFVSNNNSWEWYDFYRPKGNNIQRELFKSAASD